MADKEESLLSKLRKVQVELKAPKSQYNSFGKYSYRNQEDILEAVKPLLDKYDLTMTVSDEVRVRGTEGANPRYYVVATVCVCDESDHAIRTTAEAREEENKKGMDGAQVTGAASSYARKYALNGMFLIDDTKDADSEEHRNQTQAKTTQTKPAPAKAAPRAKTITKEQITLMYQTMKEKGYTDKAQATEILVNFSDVNTLAEMTETQAATTLAKLIATDKSVLDTFFGGSEN